MLTIHMPDGHKDKHAVRRRRAFGYLISGLLIMASLFLAWGTPVWFVPPLIEAWWIWASITGLEP